MAWPLAIVSVVLVVGYDFAFSGLVTNQHGDVLAFQLPTACFLGRSLATGHIPAWNPYVMGGVPFVADPQSGWMHLPLMALFAVLSCGTALRWYVLLLPMGVGLGVYWFLRAEQVSRPACAAAGIVAALAVASSWIGQSVPFAASLAWSALLLAAAAMLLRTSSWPRRLAWAGLVALAWGQLAAAYLSNGLAIGTSLLAIYLLTKLTADLVTRRRRWPEVVMLVALLVVALPLVNLAVLLPRLQYLPSTTLGHGYRSLQALTARLPIGASPVPATSHYGGVRSTWVLGLAVPPGAYCGAGALALAFGGFFNRLRLLLAVAIGGFGAFWYALTLPPVVQFVGSHFGSDSWADFYLHAPARMRYPVVLAVALMAGLGVEAWQQARGPITRVLMIAPGIVVWWALPRILNVEPSYPGLFLLGATGAAVALAASGWKPALIPVIVAVLVVELVTSGLQGQRTPYVRNGVGAPSLPSGSFPPLYGPTVDVAAYLRPTPVAQFLRAQELQSVDAGRFITLAPELLSPSVGYLALQRPGFWGMLNNQRSMLFDLEDAQGYNPIQSLRYWEFVRTVSRRGINYNLAFFRPAGPLALDLLDIEWIIGSALTGPAIPGAVPQVRDGRWELYRIPGIAPRATVLTSWRVVGSDELARRAVTDLRFEPTRQVVVERDPGLGSTGGSPRRPGGSATYRSTGPQSAVIEVQANAPAVVVVRNTYDPGWRATMDGRPVHVLAADFLIQGVPVPPGRHTIVLSYQAPGIGEGLLGSALSLIALFGTALALEIRGRRRGMRPLA